MNLIEPNQKIIDTLSFAFHSHFENFKVFILTQETKKYLEILYDFHTQFLNVSLNHIIPNLTKNSSVRTLKLLQQENELSKYSKGFAIFCKILVQNFKSKNNYSIYEVFIKHFINNSKKNDVIIYFLNLDFEIFQNLILNIIENIRFDYTFKSITKSIRPDDAVYILQQIIKIFPNLLLKDELLIDDIVEHLHNFILNVKISYNIDKLIEKTLNLLIELQKLAFVQDNLVTCTNIDNILQFHISIDKFKINNYIVSFEGKDSNWIENSLLSLNNLIFSDLYEISFSTEYKNISWSLVMRYFNFYSLLITQLNETQTLLSISTLRPLYDNLLKICKFINIPQEYNSNFENYFCTIISYAYKFNLTPFDHGKFFSVLLSYLSFSPDLNIRKKSFDAINEILDWDKNNIISKLFKFKDSNNFKEIFINLISDYENETNCLLLFKQIQQKIDNKFKDFNFVELLHFFFNFNNLFVLENYIDILSCYSKSLKRILVTEIDKSNEFDSYFKYYITSLITKRALSDKLRYEVIPIYPNCSKKQVRMYLYILHRYKSKKFDDRDLMILDMFRFDDDDIISFFIRIFDSYTLTYSIINGLIERLSNQNLILLSIFKSSLKLYNNLLVSVDKFKLINACIIGEKSKNIIFLKFFNEIVQSDEIEILNLHPFYYILKMIEVPYLSWSSNERLSFWQEIMKIAITLNLSDIFSKNLDKFLESLYICKKKYLIVASTIVIPLTVDEVENSTAEQLERLISIKVQAFKSNTQSNLKLIKKVNSKNKKEKPLNEKTISKRDQSIVKSQHVHSDLTQSDIPVLITIYTKGKICESEPVNPEKRFFNRLSPIERKKLFSNQVSVINYEYKVTINGTRAIITSYSAHLIKIIINDIFKGLFTKHDDIIEMIGIMFNTKLNFKNNNDILNCLKNVKLDKSEITRYLFIKLAFYLKGQKLTSNKIDYKIYQMELRNPHLSLFIQEEKKLI